MAHIHHMIHVHRSGLSGADWAQIAAAAFTALTALAAFASVWRVEHDRREATIPELYVETVADAVHQEMRMTIANLGASAREVRVLGAIENFGWTHLTPPSPYWRPGESRTYRIAIPFTTDSVSYVFVEGRDVGKRYLVLATVGGATYRYPLRKAEKMSPASEWRSCSPASRCRWIGPCHKSLLSL